MTPTLRISSPVKAIPLWLNPAAWTAEEADPLRKLALYAAVGLIFLRCSLLHEVLTYYVNSPTYILYLFAIPALLGVLRSGGLRRTFSSTPGKYWLLFTLWFFLSVPFSTWRGDSAAYALSFIRVTLPMLFIASGLALNWKECRLMLLAIAMGAIFITGSGLLLKRGADYRGGLEFGVVSNPNDYAGHLIFVLPFLLLLIAYPPKNIFVQGIARITGVVALLLGLYLTLNSASRGALIGLGCCALVAFWRSRMLTRIGLLLLLPILGLAFYRLLPENVISRLAAFSVEAPTDSSTVSGEAQASSMIRQSLLKESIVLSFEKPLFGVGAGQFGNYLGTAKNDASIPAWYGTHNSYTQVSAECGLPALFFYLGAMISSVLILNRTWKQVKNHPAFPQSQTLQQIAFACYCIALSYTGFCVAIVFLNFAYFFYLPALSGIILTVSLAAQAEMNRATATLSPASGRVPVSATVGVRSGFGVQSGFGRPAFTPAATIPTAPLSPPPAPVPTAAGNRSIRFNRYR